jgi:hypothetical protein
MTELTPETVQGSDAASTPSEDVKTDVQDSTQAEESTVSEADKIRTEMQKRIDRLTAARHAEAKRAEQAEQELGKYRPKQDGPKAPVKPLPDKYDSQEAYEADLDKWTDEMADFKAEQKLSEAKKKAEEETAQKTRAESVEKRLKAMDKKGAEFSKVTPDYDQKVDLVNEMVSLSTMSPEQRFAALDTLLDCENGPQVMYHLGNNPEALEAMFKMAPHQIIRELTKLDLAQETQPETQQTQPEKVLAPPTPIKSSGKVSKSLDDMSGKEILAEMERFKKHR